MFLTEFNIFDYIWPIAIGLLAGWFIARRRKNNDNDSVILLDAEDFNKNMRKGQLVDIRPAEDWKKIKINGSRNFPKNDVFNNRYKLRQDLPVFIYEEKGFNKAKSLANRLARKGFNPVYVLKTGLEEWPYQKKEQ